MRLSPWLGGPELNAGAAGGFRVPPIVLSLTPSLTHIVIAADVRYMEGITGGHLVPLLFQSTRVYIQADPGELISSTAWSRAATRAFAISSFVQIGFASPGVSVPLSPAVPASIGFAVRITGAFGSGPPTSNYGVDNINLLVVPAPGAAGALAGAILTLRRRRR